MSNDRSVVTLYVSTKKGLWTLTSDSRRQAWSLKGPSLLGHIVNHAVPDPRDRRTVVVAARTGHLGPTIFRSTDLGHSWKEASKPPAFPKVEEGTDARVVSHTFALVPGHETEPDVWYAGTSPEGLFRSEDGGDTWTGVSGFNESAWAGAMPQVETEGPQQNTPDGDILHSIVIDPRDADHLYIAMSANAGGVFESTDRGGTWSPLNRGCETSFFPEPARRLGTIRTACSSTRLRPTSSGSRTTVASTGWNDRVRSGTALAATCRKTWVTSVFQLHSTRVSPTRRGCFRWMAPTCGHASVRMDGRRCTGRAMRERAGSAVIVGFHSTRPGTPFFVKA